ncbi:MAG: aminodeoxychorismate synthase component I [Planctomycetota bacterium]
MNLYNFYNRPYPFFLISSMPHKEWGRFSFIGSDPFLVLKSKGRNISIEQNGKVLHKKGNPLEELRIILNRYKTSPDHKSGAPFTAGAVGYLGYDLCHFIEDIPSTAKDDLKLPDMFFGFYGKGSVGTVRSVNSVIPVKGLNRLSRNNGVTSNFTRPEYLRAVRRVKEYIFAGDIYQANLSQRFEMPFHKHPLELFRTLQEINPAPFSALLKPNDNQFIISSSPERFLKVSNGIVETRPIKGTRPRGKTPAQDEQLKKELFNSIKDNAELAMIVDMERNDLGRVCEYGSVKVIQQKVLETYPTLHHLVATVKGRMDNRYDLVDLIKATFPGGSITGVPKIRAMEIIDELEPTRRNVYTGAIGYIGFDGTMDLSIAIRIIMLNGNKAYYQVGGGIVADSDPAGEYEETLTKGKALMQAINCH